MLDAAATDRYEALAELRPSMLDSRSCEGFPTPARGLVAHASDWPASETLHTKANAAPNIERQLTAPELTTSAPYMRIVSGAGSCSLTPPFRISSRSVFHMEITRAIELHLPTLRRQTSHAFQDQAQPGRFQERMAGVSPSDRLGKTDTVQPPCAAVAPPFDRWRRRNSGARLAAAHAPMMVLGWRNGRASEGVVALKNRSGVAGLYACQSAAGVKMRR